MLNSSQTGLHPHDHYRPTAVEGNPWKLSYSLLALIFVLLMLLLLNTGCAPVLAAKSPADTSSAGTILYADDFSRLTRDWGVWNRDGATVAYEKGGLHIQVNQPQYDFWSVAGQNFRDTQIEVDVAKIGGPDDNDFGVVCRYLNKDNFYMLVISSDGYFGMAKMKGGQYSMIGAEQLQYSGAIVPGIALNHLRADCIGSTLRLFANGQKLMEAQDGDFSSGDVGVMAGSYDTGGIDILFDNFQVKKP